MQKIATRRNVLLLSIDKDKFFMLKNISKIIVKILIIICFQFLASGGLMLGTCRKTVLPV